MIYYCGDPRQHDIYLFYRIKSNKQNNVHGVFTYVSVLKTIMNRNKLEKMISHYFLIQIVIQLK